MPLHRTGIEGNERIKISAPSRHGSIGRNGYAEEQHARQKAPYSEEICQREDYHSHKLEGVAELLTLLSKIRNGNASHIKDYLLRHPTDTDGKITEDKTADDGE